MSKAPGAMGLLGQKLGDKQKTMKDATKQSSGDSYQLIDTALVDSWMLSNRPDEELEIDSLVESIRVSGQRIPILVRPVGDRFERIYGRRRFLSCQKLGIKVKAIVAPLTDREAFVEQYLENSERKDLSAWAISLDYQRALDNKIFPNAAALAGSCGIDATTVSNYLCFGRLPSDLIKAIGDLQKVAVRTAVVISRNTDNKKLMSELLMRADEIRTGKLNAYKIEEILAGNKKTSKPKPIAGRFLSLSRAGDRLTVKLKKGVSKPELDDKLLAVLDQFFEENQ